jgi:hypothetical protein
VQLQGDLHLVAIPDTVVGSGQSENYANALKAYWQGSKMGKKALAKNGIIVVLGVNTQNKTITWARAKTGMPVGNGEMLAAIENRLPGKPFDPDAILGNIKAQVKQDDKGNLTASYQLGNSALEQIVFHDYPFARARMGTGKNQTGSTFTYLKADIKMPTWAYVLDAFLAGFVGLLGGLALIVTSADAMQYSSTPRSRYRY